MMTGEQQSRVTELKATVAATVATRQGTPEEVRVAVVALRRELQRGGVTASSFAASLGVHVSTLCRWELDVGRREAAAPEATRRQRAPGAGFRRVEVAAPTALTPVGVSSVKQAARGLRVAHAPSGLVIDGLDVETLAALLQRMS
jgi:DNA-binding transcriptional regulator YiaG